MRAGTDVEPAGRPLAATGCAGVRSAPAAVAPPGRRVPGFGAGELSGEAAPPDDRVAISMPGRALLGGAGDRVGLAAAGPAAGLRFKDAAGALARPDTAPDPEGGALTVETFPTPPGVVNEDAILVAESTMGAMATHAVGESGFGWVAALAAGAAALATCAAVAGAAFDAGATFASTRCAPVEPGCAGVPAEAACGSAPTEPGCGGAFFAWGGSGAFFASGCAGVLTAAGADLPCTPACNDPLGAPR
jgi:hypothetical protein